MTNLRARSNSLDKLHPGKQWNRSKTMTSRPATMNIPAALRLWHRILKWIVYLIALIVLGALLMAMLVVMLISSGLHRVGDRRTARPAYQSEGNECRGASGRTGWGGAPPADADAGASSATGTAVRARVPASLAERTEPEVAKPSIEAALK